MLFPSVLFSLGAVYNDERTRLIIRQGVYRGLFSRSIRIRVKKSNDGNPAARITQSRMIIRPI